MDHSRFYIVVWLGLVTILLLIYGGDIGRGFVKDDVVWVGANQVHSLNDAWALLFRTQGFYRPVVSASFAVDRAIHGLDTFGFGVTNFCLLLIATFALTRVARALGLSAAASAIVGAIWTLNFHGVNMALLWLSGRTALWLAVWSFLAALALLKQKPLLTGAAAALAMFSKEEAVMLPLILSGWAWILGETNSTSAAARIRTVAKLVWPCWVALGVYFVMRGQTDAMTPLNSPPSYRFRSDALLILESLGEYTDRACTFSALALVLAFLVARTRPRISPGIRRVAFLGAIWFAGTYALTLFLPSRSSLYALLPSAAPALVAGALLQDLWLASSTAVRRRVAVVAAAMPLLLLPIYWERNVRWTEIGDLSRETFRVVNDVSTKRPGVSHLVFHDDPTTRRSFANTYGELLPQAVRLAAGREMLVTVAGDGESGPEIRSGPGNGKSVDIVLARGHVSMIE